MAGNGNGLSKAENKEWQAFKSSWEEILRMFGSLLFSPFFLIIGIGYGIRAGLIEGIEKTLEMMKGWK